MYTHLHITQPVSTLSFIRLYPFVRFVVTTCTFIFSYSYSSFRLEIYPYVTPPM